MVIELESSVMRGTMRLSLTRLVVLGACVAALTSGCGGGDDENASVGESPAAKEWCKNALGVATKIKVNQDILRSGITGSNASEAIQALGAADEYREKLFDAPPPELKSQMKALREIDPNSVRSSEKQELADAYSTVNSYLTDVCDVDLDIAIQPLTL